MKSVTFYQNFDNVTKSEDFCNFGEKANLALLFGAPHVTFDQKVDFLNKSRLSPIGGGPKMSLF